MSFLVRPALLLALLLAFSLVNVVSGAQSMLRTRRPGVRLTRGVPRAGIA